MASFLIAIKFNEDIYYSNGFYSKVGGITLAELDELEYSFLILTNFNIYVNPDLYNKYYESFINSYKTDEEESEEEDDLAFHKGESMKYKSSKKNRVDKKMSDLGKKPCEKKNSGSSGTVKRWTLWSYFRRRNGHSYSGWWRTFKGN